MRHAEAAKMMREGEFRGQASYEQEEGAGRDIIQVREVGRYGEEKQAEEMKSKWGAERNRGQG
jgi:hypothetical protein